MKRNVQYDYYLIEVPGDLADNLTDLAMQAIREAEERARLYCSPCLWTTKHLSGEPGDFTVKFRVCRQRNRRTS